MSQTVVIHRTISHRYNLRLRSYPSKDLPLVSDGDRSAAASIPLTRKRCNSLSSELDDPRQYIGEQDAASKSKRLRINGKPNQTTQTRTKSLRQPRNTCETDKQNLLKLPENLQLKTEADNSMNSTPKHTRPTSCPTATSSVKPTEDRIYELFDWFAEQEWAEEYCTNAGGISVGIRDISESAAKKEMLESSFNDMVDWCSFGKPIAGEYEEFADDEERFVEQRHLLKPGDSIVNKSTPLGRGRRALYTGSLIDPASPIRSPGIGISVSHLFKSPNDRNIYIKTDVVGSLIHKVDEVFLQPNRKRRTTADLSFLEIDGSVCLRNNKVVIEGITYSLKLYPNAIEEGLQVIIVDRDGKVCRGKIKNRQFNHRGHKVFNMLTIIDANVTDDDVDQIICEKGDSGALVMCQDITDCEETMYAIGIVKGALYYINPPTQRGITTATRLRDILLAIGRDRTHCKKLKRGGVSYRCSFFDDADFQ